MRHRPGFGKVRVISNKGEVLRQANAGCRNPEKRTRIHTRTGEET